MTGERRSWDRDYGTRGRLWGDAVGIIPDFPAASQVLDIGCGNGKTVRALQSRGLEITAIDFSSHAVKLCRHYSCRTKSFSLAIADARHLPFHDDTFDGIIAIHVIGHMLGHDRKQCSFESARVLRYGGTLVFCEFSVKDFRAGIGDEVEAGTFCRGNGIITHYFKSSEVLNLFSRLTPVSSKTRHWTMKVRGNTLVREEIETVFTKRGP